MQENTQENKPKKSKVELVKAMQREFNEIQSIMESISELKEEAKSSGYDATMLAKIAKAMSEAKLEDILDKNAEFEATVEEVRG